MDYNKLRKFCRKFRIAIGVILIVVGFITGNYWFFLGIIPLVAGLADFCPTCILTKKCDLPEEKREEEPKKEA